MEMSMKSYSSLFVPLLIIGLQSGVDCAGSAAGNLISNDRTPSAKQLIAVDRPQLPTYQAVPRQPPYPNYQPRPVYFYPPYYWPLRQRNTRSRGRSHLLYYALSMLTETTTTTTKASTSPPTTVSGCSYGPWSTCSSVCLGTETRSALCSGVTTTQSRNCNTQLGFLSNGWYRAFNCYDYVVSGSGTFTYDEGKDACEATGGRLASAGIRDLDVLFDVMEALIQANVEPIRFYIGADRTSGKWVWSDGVTVEPNVWTLTQPGTNVQDHIQMAIGNTRSGIDVNGNADLHYMCERAAQ